MRFRQLAQRQQNALLALIEHNHSRRKLKPNAPDRAHQAHDSPMQNLLSVLSTSVISASHSGLIVVVSFSTKVQLRANI